MNDGGARFWCLATNAFPDENERASSTENVADTECSVQAGILAAEFEKGSTTPLDVKGRDGSRGMTLGDSLWYLGRVVVWDTPCNVVP